MRIISVNTNGIRAAARKGFYEWMVQQQADVVCIQELKAKEVQLEGTDTFYPEGYHAYFHEAEKPGYSGVALYCKEKPLEVQFGLGEGWEDIDKEGRFILARFKNIIVISLYMHSGSSSEERQTLKFDFMERFMPYLRELQQREEEVVICGDWNIAHKKIDIKNWRGNQKNSGFLPEEREWMDQLFGEENFVDTFRQVNQEEHQYTWWSNRGQAWANNTGWRIDYQVATPAVGATVTGAAVYKDERFSDHAPLTIDYDFELIA